MELTFQKKVQDAANLMYRQAVVAVDTLKDQKSQSDTRSADKTATAVDDDFNISSPIIDSEGTGIYEMDMPGGATESHFNSVNNINEQAGSNNVLNFQTAETPIPANTATDSVILDSLAKQFKSDVPVSDTPAKRVIPPVKEKVEHHHRTSAAHHKRRPVSSMDMAKRKELLSSFKPKVCPC